MDDFYTSEDGWRCVRRSNREVTRGRISFIFFAVLAPLLDLGVACMWFIIGGAQALVGIPFVAAAAWLAYKGFGLYHYVWHGRLRRADATDYALDNLRNIYN